MSTTQRKRLIGLMIRTFRLLCRNIIIIIIIIIIITLIVVNLQQLKIIRSYVIDFKYIQSN